MLRSNDLGVWENGCIRELVKASMAPKQEVWQWEIASLARKAATESVCTLFAN